MTTNLNPSQNPFTILLLVIAIALSLCVLVSIFKPLALTACIYVLVSYGIAWLKGGREYISSLSFIEILKWPVKLFKKNE
jgi:hypothetical protein